MPAAARLNDSVSGTTGGSAHSPETFTGEISSGCSGDVFINGLPAATVGSVTTERDSCCGSSNGSIASGSGSVFINGRPTARQGDDLSAHSGSGKVASGSPDVSIGG